MRRIAVIATYFGNWPIWFPAFLRSCETNSSIDWLLYSDCPPLARTPPNVRVLPCSMAEVNERASRATGLEIRKSLYSQCDLRPTYGLTFASDLAGYDWWGHCDLDVIWGNLEKALDESDFEQGDLFSSLQGPRSPRLPNSVAGHFMLWRNTDRVNRLYQSFPDHARKLSSPEHHIFDEEDVSRFLQRPDCPVRMVWSNRPLADYYDLEHSPYGWSWKDGTLRDANGQEWHYLHFMTWKRYLKQIDFDVTESPHSFVIQRRGIWSKGMPPREEAMRRLGLDTWFYRALSVKRAGQRALITVLGEDFRKRALARKRRQW